jgi:hypothetical protein
MKARLEMESSMYWMSLQLQNCDYDVCGYFLCEDAMAYSLATWYLLRYRRHDERS